MLTEFQSKLKENYLKELGIDEMIILKPFQIKKV
jgi:hypothetical protein